MTKKLNNNDIKEIIEERGYELLNLEKRKDKKGKNRLYITIKCKHGHIVEMMWDNFKKGKGCKTCASNKRGLECRLDEKDIRREVEKRGYVFISTYFIEKGKRVIKIKCNQGHEIEMCWNDFKSGNNCGYCSKNKRYSFEEVEEFIKNFNYKLLSNEYKNSTSKLTVQCPHGHKPYDVSFGKFKQGRRCPYCANNVKYTYEDVKIYVESFGYKLLSEEYINNTIPLKLECPNGHVTDTLNFNNFKNKEYRCSVCNESKGEKEIEKILNKFNINYNTQHKFDNCKFKRRLPFDFYLPDLNICIEYDGELHYQIKEHFGGLDGFIDRMIRDTVKNEYCKKNNIKLIRIPYWDFDNIEEILKCELGL